MVGGHVMPLPRITRQIKEPGLLTDGVHRKLPIPMAHRAISPRPPEERFMGTFGCARPPGKGQETDPIDGPRKRRSRCLRDGGNDIEVMDRCLKGGALRQPLGPAHEERHVNATLKIGDLPAAVRLI